MATQDQLWTLLEVTIKTLGRDRTADANAVRDGIHRLIQAAHVREQSAERLRVRKPRAGGAK